MTALRKTLLVLLGLGGLIFLIATTSTESVIWQWDLIRGYQFAYPTETVHGYEVTLMQAAGPDFYDSYFLIQRPDGPPFILQVDGDDAKWVNPRTKTEGSRLYYLEGDGAIDDRTSFIDQPIHHVYAGHARRLLDLTVPLPEPNGDPFTPRPIEAKAP